MSELVVACALLALAAAVVALGLAVRLLARFTAVADTEAYLNSAGNSRPLQYDPNLLKQFPEVFSDPNAFAQGVCFPVVP